MHLLRNIFSLYHETPGGVPSGGAPPDPGASGGAGTATAPGTPPPGQGQQPPQQGDTGLRQYFPNVPDDHWSIMEPHVQQMGAQITQLQQQVAPLRQAFQQGYDGEHLARLAAFDSRFRADPTETWLDIGRQLQESIDGRPPALDPDVDLDHLAALARGEDPDAAPGVPPGQPGAQQGQIQGASPEVMAYVQQLEAKLTEVQQGLQQDRTDRQTQVQDAVFDRQLAKMRDTLKKVGWPEERLTQQALTARVLVHGGRFDQATQAMVDERNDLLKGWTQSRTDNQPQPTDMPNGAPSSPDRNVRTRDSRDPFKKGTRDAAARLARANGTTRG